MFYPVNVVACLFFNCKKKPAHLEENQPGDQTQNRPAVRWQSYKLNQHAAS